MEQEWELCIPFISTETQLIPKVQYHHRVEQEWELGILLISTETQLLLKDQYHLWIEQEYELCILLISTEAQLILKSNITIGWDKNENCISCLFPQKLQKEQETKFRK